MEILAQQDSEMATVEGKIANDPEISGRSIRFVLEVAEIDRGSGMEAASGKAVVYAQPPPALAQSREPPYFKYGDVVSLQGRLQRPESSDSFDYAAYLANQGITAVLLATKGELLEQAGGLSLSNWRGWMFDVRRKLSEELENGIAHPQSSLAQAFLLGQRSRLPADLTEDFRNTGTSHLLIMPVLRVIDGDSIDHGRPEEGIGAVRPAPRLAR